MKPILTRKFRSKIRFLGHKRLSWKINYPHIIHTQDASYTPDHTFCQVWFDFLLVRRYLLANFKQKKLFLYPTTKRLTNAHHHLYNHSTRFSYSQRFMQYSNNRLFTQRLIVWFSVKIEICTAANERLFDALPRRSLGEGGPKPISAPSTRTFVNQPIAAISKRKRQ